MALLLLENRRLMNTDMVTHTEFDEHHQTASCWGYEVPMSAQSRMCYEFFWPLAQKAEEERQAMLSAGGQEKETPKVVE